MKRFILSVVVLSIICGYMISCEKDDICAEGTPTTPNMVVAFYNSGNRGAFKTVANLKIFVEGFQDTIAIGRVDSTALIPLRVDTASVKWGFKYTYTNTLGVKQEVIDYLDFSYTTRDEYVSRACGFKTLFTLNEDTSASPNPVFSDGGDGSTWIQDTEIVDTEIENEDDTHVKIYF